MRDRVGPEQIVEQNELVGPRTRFEIGEDDLQVIGLRGGPQRLARRVDKAG